eukprot:3377126-Pleurochrysis_carterae.AAC.1
MAGPACTGASDLFSPTHHPQIGFLSVSGWVVEREVGRRGAPRQGFGEVASGPPPGRNGDPERTQPRAAKQRGVNAQRPRDGQ